VVAIELDGDPSPRVGALLDPARLPEQELAHLLGAEARLGVEGHDRGSGDDAGQEALLSRFLVGCPAAQAWHSVTPWKVQMRQMNVPQLLQG
jgi:hypothetical protein